jgi:MarR family transcriptional regulator, lower aerobic nicotinate degradation pathway regulator
MPAMVRNDRASPRSAAPLESLRLLRTLIASLSRSARAIAADTGVTNAQLFLLRQIGSDGGLSVNQLAEMVHARQNTVSAVLRHLARDGWVEKSVSPTDGRRAVIRLSPAGRRLLRRAPAAPTEQLLAALQSLDPRHRRALTEGLRALVSELELEPDQAPLLFEDARKEKAAW